MAVTLDAILNQKPQWISVNEYVVGSTHAGTDDTLVDADGNIILLPEGVSNRVTGQLWGHIKNLVTILSVEHNPDGTHNLDLHLDDLIDVNINPSQDNHGLFYDVSTSEWIAREGIVNLDGIIYDGGLYNTTDFANEIDCLGVNDTHTFIVDCGYLGENIFYIIDGSFAN